MKDYLLTQTEKLLKERRRIRQDLEKLNKEMEDEIQKTKRFSD